MYFANKFPAAKIVAIEPDSENAALLRRNCAGLPNVTIIEAALWPVNRTVSLCDPGTGAWTFSVMDDRLTEKVADVATVTTQELFERLGGRIDLLKLDVEGSERELFSYDPTWLDHVGSIAIELHDRYRQGCAKAFYSALITKSFRQETKGETIFVELNLNTELVSSKN